MSLLTYFTNFPKGSFGMGSSFNRNRRSFNAKPSFDTKSSFAGSKIFRDIIDPNPINEEITNALLSNDRGLEVNDKSLSI